MDQAVAEAQRYCDHDPKKKTVQQVWYYIVSRLKRLSMRRSHHRELTAGTLSDLELIARHIPSRSFEERVFLSELVAKMTPRTRQIFEWRAAGHSLRAIARHFNVSHATLVRAYNKELRGLIFPSTFSSQDKDHG